MIRTNGRKGSLNHNAKLTEEMVKAIKRSLRRPDVTQAELAAEYKVCTKTIWNIFHGERWKHVPTYHTPNAINEAEGYG